MKVIKMIPNLVILFSLLIPDISSGIGRKYEPEEGTFDRRKRIVIQNKCRLVKQTHVPGDVVCEYQSQKRSDKNKQVYLGSPGQVCLREIICPVK